MTIRSSNQALQNQKLRRAHTFATTFRVQRRDGFVLRFTDHDRPLTVEGETFLPLGLGQVTAERREAGLKSGDQEARGPIDGDTIVIPDLLSDRYVGALVSQRIVDWRRPWVWHFAATKRVRRMALDGSNWVAVLEGVGAKLQQSVGGRFGGTSSRECVYVWGDPFTCKADRMIGLQYGPSLQFAITAATALSLTDSSQTWTPDQWVGYSVVVDVGIARGEEAHVLSNDATTVVLSKQLRITPDVSDTFVIGQGVAVETVSDDRMVFVLDDADYDESLFDDDFFRDGEAEWMTGDNVGLTSAIVGYIKSSRQVTLLLPTPFPIVVGDRAIIRTGCDGKKLTCIEKFAPIPGTTTTGDGNVDNYGGPAVYSPQRGLSLEQPT